MQIKNSLFINSAKEDIRKKIAEMQIERSKKQKQASQAAIQPSKTFKLSQGIKSCFFKFQINKHKFCET